MPIFLPTSSNAGDELVEGVGHVFEIDEHVHDEDTADDFLFEVFDIDARSATKVANWRRSPFWSRP